MIDVELLKKVMGLDDVADFRIDDETSELIIYDSFEVANKVCGLPINIYELAYKIQEYLSDEYNIFISLDCPLEAFYSDANRLYREAN